MLTKYPESKKADSNQTSRSRTRPSKEAAVLPASFEEPQRGWAPLRKAPYYCTLTGYIRSVEKWAEVIGRELERIILKEWSEPREQYSLVCKRQFAAVTISTMGITTLIEPGFIWVFLKDFPGVESWQIGGGLEEVLQSEKWDSVSPDDRIAARRHRRLLQLLFNDWHDNFKAAVESGALHIMARKNSVLEPFERVTWDQWQFFSLDDVPSLPKNTKWYDPKNNHPYRDERTTATGPAGERLYAIYVAPGVSESVIDENDPEKKCVGWIVKSMRDSPERAPEPLDSLAKKAISLFPGLSKKGFRHCYFLAQRETGNRNWSRPGAPPKTQQ